MAGPTEPESAKPRKPRAGKPPKAQDGAAQSKVKATLHLSVEASRRLSVHAAMTGLDRSALVEKLIVENLRRFVVSDRGGGGPIAILGPVEDPERRTG